MTLAFDRLPFLVSFFGKIVSEPKYLTTLSIAPSIFCPFFFFFFFAKNQICTKLVIVESIIVGAFPTL
jgi:hypothetical protein